MIKGLLVDVKKNKIEVVEIEEGYQALQRVINVGTFTVVTRKFGDTWYDVYADDEGWLTEEYNPASVYTYSEDGGQIVEVLVGSVFIANSTKNGHVISLTKDDINKVLQTARVILDGQEGRFRNVLTCTI